MKKKIALILISGLLLICCGIFLIVFARVSIDRRSQSVEKINAFISAYKPVPFVNDTIPASSQSDSTPTNAFYTYKGPEGFTIYSYSEEWDDDKLVELYNELLKNRHGKEIEILDKIVIHPDASETMIGQHTSDKKDVALNLTFGALPKGFCLKFPRDISVIELFDGDTNTTVESMDWTLSHEYGHLYTFYYFFDQESSNLYNTGYAKLREPDKYDLIASALPEGDYVLQHHRYLFEIAAEDYVQLMGSPTTRQVVEYPDIRQMLSGMEYPDEIEQRLASNLRPQENLMIPLAFEVSGLSEYYYSFLDEKPPVPVEEKQVIELSIEKDSVGYDLIDGYRTFVYYTLTWNTPYEDATYTVIHRSPSEYYALPIKTVLPGNTASATIGTYAISTGSYIHWQYDEIDEGEKFFYVIAQLPDGTYYMSEPLEYTF